MPARQQNKAEQGRRRSKVRMQDVEGAVFAHTCLVLDEMEVMYSQERENKVSIPSNSIDPIQYF